LLYETQEKLQITLVTVIHLSTYFETTISKAKNKRLSLHCKYNRKNKRQDFGLDSSYYTAEKGIFSVLVRLQQHKSTHVGTRVYEMQRTGQEKLIWSFKEEHSAVNNNAIMIIITTRTHRLRPLEHRDIRIKTHKIVQFWFG
jgi:protein-arginine kinase activator protein McsA